MLEEQKHSVKLDSVSGMIARAYKIFTWLSLDVTAGAIVFMCFLAQEFDITVRWSESAALGLAVWIIYSIDHLLDVRKAVDPITSRRTFHRQHSKFLLLGTAVALCIGFWITSLLSSGIIITGGILAVVAVCYLIVVQVNHLSRFKEVQIGIGYAVGVSLVPMVGLDEILVWHWLSLVLLFLIALINLILFSWYERVQDRQEGFSSIVLSIGEKKTSLILFVLLVLLIFGGISIGQVGGSIRLVTFFLFAAGVDFCLWRFSTFFQTNDRYRAVGDAVFFLPLIWLL